MKKKVIVTVSTPVINSKCKTSFEIDDDWTEDEIREQAEECLWGLIEFDYVVEENHKNE